MRNSLFKTISFLLLTTTITPIFSEDANTETSEVITASNACDATQSEDKHEITHHHQLSSAENSSSDENNTPEISDQTQTEFIPEPEQKPESLSDQLMAASSACDPTQLEKLLLEINPENYELIQKAYLKAIKRCTTDKNGSEVIKKFADSINLNKPTLEYNGTKITPLMAASLKAAKTGCMEILDILLEQDGDPLVENSPDKEPFSTYHAHFELFSNPENADDYPYNVKVITLLKEAILQIDPKYTFAKKPEWKKEQEQQELLDYINRLRKRSFKKRLEIINEATENCDHKELDTVLASFDGSILPEIGQALVIEALQCFNNLKMIDVLAKHNIPLNSELFTIQPLLSFALICAEKSTSVQKITALQKMLVYGADPNYENQSNNEKIGSTLDVFKRHTDRNSEKYPHAAFVYYLLEQKAMETRPFIAEETKKLWSEIWSSL